MADNIAITAGSGTTVATDDVSGVHFQRVKLVDGTGDSSAGIPGDATNGLKVQVATASFQVAEDSTHVSGDLGIPALAVRTDALTNRTSADGDYANLQVDAVGRLRVAGPTRKRVSVAPSVSTGSYTTGDQVGGVMTFDVAALSGGSGRVVSAILTDRTTTSNATLELWLFAVSPTMTGVDNAAFDMSDANLEAAHLLGVVQFLNYHNTVAGRAALGTVAGVPIAGAPVSFVTEGSTNIYGVMVTRSSLQLSATANITPDLVVSLTVEQD